MYYDLLYLHVNKYLSIKNSYLSIIILQLLQFFITDYLFCYITTFDYSSYLYTYLSSILLFKLVIYS